MLADVHGSSGRMEGSGSDEDNQPEDGGDDGDDHRKGVRPDLWMWCGYLSKETDPSGYPHPRPPYLHSAFHICHTSPGPGDAINSLSPLQSPFSHFLSFFKRSIFCPHTLSNFATNFGYKLIVNGPAWVCHWGKALIPKQLMPSNGKDEQSTTHLTCLFDFWLLPQNISSIGDLVTHSDMAL